MAKCYEASPLRPRTITIKQKSLNRDPIFGVTQYRMRLYAHDQTFQMRGPSRLCYKFLFECVVVTCVVYVVLTKALPELVIVTNKSDYD